MGKHERTSNFNVKKTYFITAFFLLFVVSFVSCNEKEKEIDKPKTDEQLIIGKWKLEKVCDAHPNQMGGTVIIECFNHLQFNVIYEFRENNVLIISGGIDDIDEYRGHETGEHFYRLQTTWAGTPPPYWFEINDVLYMHWLDADAGTLMLRRSYEDLYPWNPVVELGLEDMIFPVYYFVKINRE